MADNQFCTDAYHLWMLTFWGVMGLAIHTLQKMRNRVIEEQLQVIAKHGRELSFEAVKDMPVLHSCI